MAQDFYNALVTMPLGRLAMIQTINPVDLLGVLVSAIQALEARTREWQEMTKMQSSGQKLCLWKKT